MSNNVHGYAFSFLYLAAILFTIRVVSAQTIVLKADSYLDVEKGKIVRPAVIVIEHGLIKNINPQKLPGGVETIELGDLDFATRPDRYAHSPLNGLHFRLSRFSA